MARSPCQYLQQYLTYISCMFVYLFCLFIQEGLSPYIYQISCVFESLLSPSSYLSCVWLFTPFLQTFYSIDLFLLGMCLHYYTLVASQFFHMFLFNHDTVPEYGLSLNYSSVCFRNDLSFESHFPWSWNDDRRRRENKEDQRKGSAHSRFSCVF